MSLKTLAIKKMIKTAETKSSDFVVHYSKHILYEMRSQDSDTPRGMPLLTDKNRLSCDSCFPGITLASNYVL